MYIDSAALSSLFAEPFPRGLVQSSAYEAKFYQTGAPQTLVWDFDHTVVPLTNVGYWTAGISLSLKTLCQTLKGEGQYGFDSICATILVVDSLRTT